ncbi:hypothetical protein KGO5_03146 [Sinorhizobium sp. KGO-5]|jgi:hypothetical protein|nr:hypothetical protein KGO5_03146 [Sinorhizobium sp. KGO-5]
MSTRRNIGESKLPLTGWREWLPTLILSPLAGRADEGGAATSLLPVKTVRRWPAGRMRGLSMHGSSRHG